MKRHDLALARRLYAKAPASETKGQGKLNETLVKQFTGSEELKGRHMRQDFFTFKNQSKIILMTNHRPVIEGTDYAIWRRLQLIPFNQRYIKGKNRDDTLWAKLDQNELPGILRWCVAGCLEWQRIGLQPPEVVRERRGKAEIPEMAMAEIAGKRYR